ncbi:coiled-coil domain-containing protein [Pseudomonas saxonica]|jgi:hypothetical protein|uniref:Uncharacterized protein n=2 Tax=Bacteria TaxID=2 RepID=A0A5C5PRI2_9PSED|nr:hypothetical protein [Pseudomonas saxonica]TWR77670.1 hypothetical protein FJD37_23730 [Pseudomonas saxonica]
MSNSKTMIWKRLNYTSGKKVDNTPGISQLKTSLEHSLRIIQKDELEFNKDLINKNYVFFNGEVSNMSKLSIDERKNIFNSIYSPLLEVKEEQKELVEINSNLSKQAYKIKELIKKNEDELLTKFLQDLLNSDGYIVPDSSGLIRNFDVKRIEQKINCIDKYIALNNEVVDLKSDSKFSLKKTAIQETFFKFPINQLVDNIKPIHYMSIISKFYKTYLPDYPIKLIVFHGDEIANEEEQNVGVHPHIFIDGKNSKTGKYNIINDEFKLINSYLKSEGKAEITGRKFSDAQMLGTVYQEIIYKFVNAELKNLKYDLSVKVLPDSPEKKIRNKLIKKDTSKPKIHRVYNSINKGIEDLKKVNSSLEINIKNKEKLDIEIAEILNKQEEILKNNESLKSKNLTLESSILKNNETVNKQENNIKILGKNENILERRIIEKTDEIILLDEEFDDKKTLYEQLSEAFSSVKMFVSVCINRVIKYNSMPNNYHIKEVNKDLDIIYKNVSDKEGLNLIDNMLDEQEKVLNSNNVPLEFKRDSSNKRKARIKP